VNGTIAILAAALLAVAGALSALMWQRAPSAAPARSEVRDRRAGAREVMVRDQIEARGVRDPAVLAAMRKVPRHEFVPEPARALAYADRPLPIGLEQTISQPYIVALMSELCAVGRGARVLEIGTGSGYQAAVMAEIVAAEGARPASPAGSVYSIEIVEPLARRAREVLARLGYRAVKTRVGDGYAGWSEAAPFDCVLVTAAPPRVPEPLKQQLKVGGRLVIPVGSAQQELRVITRTPRGFEERAVIPVRFVPMTGKASDSAPN
jgi:protein-L-isoaspartate(D-aspartate) O-methyltransferase